MKYLLIIILGTITLQVSYAQAEPLFKFGLVADPQYADKPTKNNRHYRESLWKLSEAIDTFNYHKVDFVQTLGDVIDGEWKSYDSILPVYDQLDANIENYQLLGNHDFSIDSIHLKDLLGKLSMPNYYYSYSYEGWRFIVLDATDYSYYSNPLHNHDKNQVSFYYENTKGKANKQLWNSAIGEEQQNWLKQELDNASLMNQKVILFSHLPLRPVGNSHNLWNDYEVVDIIENYSNVVAFINGHNHAGNYIFQNGIHYITIFGMADTTISSYGIIEIYEDKLVLRGYGNQITLVLDTE